MLYTRASLPVATQLTDWSVQLQASIDVHCCIYQSIYSARMDASEQVSWHPAQFIYRLRLLTGCLWTSDDWELAVLRALQSKGTNGTNAGCSSNTRHTRAGTSCSSSIGQILHIGTVSAFNDQVPLIAAYHTHAAWKCVHAI